MLFGPVGGVRSELRAVVVVGVSLYLFFAGREEADGGFVRRV